MATAVIFPHEDPISYEEELNRTMQGTDPEASLSVIHVNGDHICYCYECQNTFIGSQWDMVCANCLRLYYIVE